MGMADRHPAKYGRLFIPTTGPFGLLDQHYPKGHVGRPSALDQKAIIIAVGDCIMLCPIGAQSLFLFVIGCMYGSNRRYYYECPPCSAALKLPSSHNHDRSTPMLTSMEIPNICVHRYPHFSTALYTPSLPHPSSHPLPISYWPFTVLLPHDLRTLDKFQQDW